MIHTDLYGDQVQIFAGLMPDGTRVVQVHGDTETWIFDTASARQLAADITAAADAADQRLVSVGGGPG